MATKKSEQLYSRANTIFLKLASLDSMTDDARVKQARALMFDYVTEIETEINKKENYRAWLKSTKKLY